MLRIHRDQLDQILLHAAMAAPFEACGLIAGLHGTVTMVYPIRNVAANPALRFAMDRQEQVRAMIDLDHRNLDLLAIFHSHPPGQSAWPSSVDLAEITYPGALNMILAPASDGLWSVAVFDLGKGSVARRDLLIY